MLINRISCYDNKSQVSSKGAKAAIAKANPATVYVNAFFSNSAKKSSLNLEPLSETLIGKIKVVNFKKISGWDMNPNNSDKYVLFMHGMSQNVSNYQDLYETMLDDNVGIFALEYQGYGENPTCKVNEKKLKSDAEAGYEYLTKEKGIKPEDIIVVGHSIGGNMASYLASKHPDIKSLILISPILSLDYVGKRFQMNPNVGMGVPQRLLELTKNIKPLKWLYNLQFNVFNFIDKIKSPTYILNSKRDTVSTIDGAERFAQIACKNGILRHFTPIESGGHKVDSEKIETVSRFLKESLSK